LLVIGFFAIVLSNYAAMALLLLFAFFFKESNNESKEFVIKSRSDYFLSFMIFLSILIVII